MPTRNFVAKNLPKNKIEGKHEYKYRKTIEQKKLDDLDLKDQLNELRSSRRRNNNQKQR